MKRHFFILIVFLLLASCRPTEKPAVLLSEVQMQDVLYKLTVLNAAKNADYALFDQYYIDTQVLIYTPYGLDSLGLIENMRYYMGRPQLHRQILAGVAERIAKMQYIAKEEEKQLEYNLLKNEHPIAEKQ